MVYVIILTALIALFKYDIKQSWFALALAFVGLYLLKKAILMNSDSSLWLSVMFISAGFVIVFCIFVPVLNDKLLLLLSVCVALASLVVYVVWQNEVHLYMFITNILGVVPAILYSFKIISFLWLVILVILVNIVNLVVYKLFIYLFAK